MNYEWLVEELLEYMAQLCKRELSSIIGHCSLCNIKVLTLS